MALHALGRLATELASSRRRAYPVIAVVVALPRLVVLLDQRGSILAPFTFGEKSDDIARTFVASGTFGFIPGHPTAYTQPLYSYFLIPLYWVFGRSWEIVGGAQILVAIATSLLVYEIGRRWLPSWAGLCAALLVSVHPYSLWHDVHVNREILDGLLAAAIFLFSTGTARPPLGQARGRAGRGVRAGDPEQRPADRTAAVRRRALPLVLAAEQAGLRADRDDARGLRRRAGAVGDPEPRPGRLLRADDRLARILAGMPAHSNSSRSERSAASRSSRRRHTR